jgi:hypothetical protein
LKGGFYTTALLYYDRTNDYNLWSNNHVCFNGIGGITSAAPQLLPVVPEGRNFCFSLLNNTNNVLYVSAQNNNLIFGKVSPNGATLNALAGPATYDFSVANIGFGYGVWIIKATHTPFKEVDIGTNQTIGGQKTFTLPPLLPTISITDPFINSIATASI